jgi:hypothetical protein
MAVFLVTGAIIGILVGLRFKVLILVPASVLATVVVIVSGSGDKRSVIVLTLVGTLFAGSVLRFLAHAYLPRRIRDRHSGTQCSTKSRAFERQFRLICHRL